MEPLRVRKARPEELPTVLELLSAAAAWWASTGHPHTWPAPFPPERVRPSLERGETYLAELPGSPTVVGTFALQWEDPRFWGEQPANAGYLHRIAIERSVAGRGVGRGMIGLALDEVRRAGRSLARLDTLAEHGPLRRYYASLGFRPVGYATVDGDRVVLLEKALGGAARPLAEVPGKK